MVYFGEATATQFIEERSVRITELEAETCGTVREPSFCQVNCSCGAGKGTSLYGDVESHFVDARIDGQPGAYVFSPGTAGEAADAHEGAENVAVNAVIEVSVFEDSHPARVPRTAVGRDRGGRCRYASNR